ncbi:MAG TPA: prepilin-type N-terminal cleavage/methylation domain-containing protein [Desulfuromonadaceae bacterium]|nr:prepilin-type N-terminal cleavage/methylation domain-containing protein [Desulfuromonadaceae bacterium]
MKLLRQSQGFTLLELMMVVAIIGLVMAMAVPAILSVTHEGPLRKSVNDVIEICSRTRAQAILGDQTMTVTFHPQTKEISTTARADPAQLTTRMGNAPTISTTLDASVAIAMLDINLGDYGASDEARVRFFPNGTSDELTIVLVSAGEYRKISLEPTTALASVEVIK